MSEDLRTRILIVGVISLALFSALFARLWYLQVIETEEHAVAAEGNRVRIVPIEAPRGRILDRRGRILVDNRVDNVVAVSRSLAGDERDDVLAKLSGLLRTPVETLEERLDDRRFADFRPVPVATGVPEAVMVAVRERRDELPGVEARQLPVRVYPHGSLAAHVLGYVGEINDQELDLRHREGYRLGDQIGKVGVEQAYEVELRGIPGFESYEVDRRGEVLRSLGERQPQRGNDVQLGIDLDVQRAAEKALARWIEVSRSTGHEAPGGAVVVLDVDDGSVVAMASYPTFDPTGFVHGIRTDVWERLNAPESHLPLNNRAIQGLYPMASTFKVVTATAGVSTGIRTPHTTITDNGVIEIGDRLFRNADSKAYGRVDLRRAITVSSDVYFYSLAEEINSLPKPADEEIQRVARLFGFDETTGIELPFEKSGRVPDRAWKSSVHRANPIAFPQGDWFTGDTVNLAIGQGDLLATPLQLANAYASLANGGTVYRTHVGARIIDRFGAVVREVEAQPEGEVAPLEELPELRAALMAGMRGVVTHEEGTASVPFANWAGPPVAGKTGTAQVGDKDDSSLFAGILPAEHPRYVVAALVEEAGAGAAVAAPIVRDVMETIVESERDGELPPIGTLEAPKVFTPDPCIGAGADSGEATTSTTSPGVTTTTVIGAVPIECPGGVTVTTQPPVEPAARPPAGDSGDEGGGDP